ncbi:autotransporter outer membrane beta-barrel domain-containing protein, partial [Pandoraea anapnoica]
SDLKSWATHTGLADGRKAMGVATSIEAGQRVAIDQNWSVTPQAQLMWSSIDARAFQDAWGSDVSMHGSNSLIGRLGVAANYTNSWKDSQGRSMNASFYGILNVYQEMLGGSSVNVAGVDFDTRTDRTWMGAGVGGSYSWADNKYTVYGESSVNTSVNHFGGNYNVKANLGFRMKF